ncbi:hypothetical protein RB601_005731 [Gaeumannomyces tritici]
MAKQHIDDLAVMPAATARDPPALRSSSDAEKQDTQGSRLAEKTSAFKSLGWLDRFLAVWILLAMVLGVLLGNFVPEVGPALQKGKFADVSIPIAVGLLVMMYPILCKVQYEVLHRTFSDRGIWKQICFSVFVNWIVAPLFMLAVAWAFLPDKGELRVGLILVGLGRCIAMVLIWTSLAGGDTEYCAILVAVNSILQMVLFAPLAILFIRVISLLGALVADRPSVHHHRPFRLAGSPGCPPNRFRRPGRRSFVRILYRHLFCHAMGVTKSKLRIQAQRDTELYSCQQQFRAGHCRRRRDIWSAK